MLPHWVSPLGQTQVPPLHTEPLQQYGLVVAQAWPGMPPVQVAANEFSMPTNESTLPTALAAMPLSTWRREGLLANSLVKSSNQEEFKKLTPL